MIKNQLLLLFIYSIPVACIAWTVTKEEVFREPREFCIRRSKSSSNFLVRKFFYLFTCEYCFSHYITILILWMTGFRLGLGDWRGVFIGGFSLVWIANIYMSLFGLIRMDMKKENQKSIWFERKTIKNGQTKTILKQLPSVPEYHFPK